MAHADFSALESKVDDLIALCDALAQENRALRDQQKTWATERAALVERNELARTKVDALIGRLETLDEGP